MVSVAAVSVAALGATIVTLPVATSLMIVYPVSAEVPPCGSSGITDTYVGTIHGSILNP